MQSWRCQLSPALGLPDRARPDRIPERQPRDRTSPYPPRRGRLQRPPAGSGGVRGGPSRWSTGLKRSPTTSTLRRTRLPWILGPRTRSSRCIRVAMVPAFLAPGAAAQPAGAGGRSSSATRRRGWCRAPPRLGTPRARSSMWVRTPNDEGIPTFAPTVAGWPAITRSRSRPAAPEARW